MVHLLLLSLAMGLAQNTEALLFSNKKRVDLFSPVLEGTVTNSDLRRDFGVDSIVATRIIAQFDVNGNGVLENSELSTCPAMSFFARLKNDRDSGIKIDLPRLKVDLGNLLSINLGGSTGVNPGDLLVFSDDNFNNLIADGKLTNSDVEIYFDVTSNVATVIIAQFDGNGDGVLDRSEFSTARCMAAFNRLKNDRDSGIKIDLARLIELKINHVFSDDDFQILIADDILTSSDLKMYFGVNSDVATAFIAQFDSNGDGVLVRSEFTTARCMTAFARLKNDRDSGKKINFARLRLILGNLGGSTVFSDDDFNNLIADRILTNSDLEMYFGVTLDVAAVIIAQFDSIVDGVLVRSEFSTARCMAAFNRLKNDRDSGIKIDLARLLDLNIIPVFSDDGFKIRIADGKLTIGNFKIYFGVTSAVATGIIAKFDSNDDGFLDRSEFTTARCMAALARLKSDRDSGIKIDLARLKLLLDLNIDHVFSDEDFDSLILDDILTNSDVEMYFGMTLDVATVIIDQFDSNGDGVLDGSEFTTARCTTALARLKSDKDSGKKIDLARLLDLNINLLFSDDDFNTRIADDILTNSDLEIYFGVTLDVAMVIIGQYDSNFDGVLDISEFTTARCMAAFNRLKNDRDSGIKIDLARLIDLNINLVFSDDDFNNLIGDDILNLSDMEVYFYVSWNVASQIVDPFDSNFDGVLDRSEFTTARCMASFARLRNDRDSGQKIDLARLKLLLDLNGDQVGPCRNVRCLNNGKCELGICKCTPGYSGDNCGINLCEIKSCPGDTPCVPIIVRSGYNCSCVERRLSINQLTSESKCDARRIITHIQEYPKRQNLKTTIPGVPGKKMVISFFDDFGIEQTTFCRFDYIQIDGIKYCGSKAPEDITLPTGLGTEVRFVSGIINQDVGYTFTYQYIDDMPGNNPCKNGGTRTPNEFCTCLDGFSGPTCQNTPIMTSPGINIEQKTTFNLLGSPGKELVLTFNDYFRSPNGNNHKDLDCGEDYVEIGGNRYCSGVTPAPITIPTGSGTSVVYKCSGEKMYKSRLSYVYTET